MLCYQTQQNANGDPGQCQLQFITLRSVKILNKMTVCKTTEKGLDVGSGLSLHAVSHSFLPPILSLRLFLPSSEGQRGTGKEEKQPEQEEQWRTGEEGEVEKERRPCIPLLFSSFLSGWKISRPPVFVGWGLVGGLSVGPLGSVCNVPPYRTFSERGWGWGRQLWRGKRDYSLAPVCCKSTLPHRVCWGMREQCCRTWVKDPDLHVEMKEAKGREAVLAS